MNRKIHLLLFLICFVVQFVGAQSKTIPYKKGDKWGFCLNTSDQLLIKPCADSFEIVYDDLPDGKVRSLYIVHCGGKTGVIDDSCRWLIDTVCLKIFEVGTWDRRQLYLLLDSKHSALYELDGTPVIPVADWTLNSLKLTWNDSTRYVYAERHGDSAYLFDENYKLLIRSEGYIERYCHGYWIFSKSSNRKGNWVRKLGMLNASGDLVLKPVYDDIEPQFRQFYDGSKSANFSGVFGLTKRNKAREVAFTLFSPDRKTLSPTLHWAYQINDSIFGVSMKKILLFNTYSNKIIEVGGSLDYEIENQFGSEKNLFFAVRQKKRGAVCDETGKVILPFQEDAYYASSVAFDNSIGFEKSINGNDTVYYYSQRGELFSQSSNTGFFDAEKNKMLKSGVVYSTYSVLNSAGDTLVKSAGNYYLGYFPPEFSSDTLYLYKQNEQEVFYVYKIYHNAEVIDSSLGLNILPNNFVALYSVIPGENSQKVFDSEFNLILEAKVLLSKPFGYTAYNKGRFTNYDHWFKKIYSDSINLTFTEPVFGEFVNVRSRVIDSKTGLPVNTKVYQSFRNYQQNWLIVKSEGKFYLTDKAMNHYFAFSDSVQSTDRSFIDKVISKRVWGMSISGKTAYDILTQSDSVFCISDDSKPPYAASLILVVKNNRLTCFDSAGKKLFSAKGPGKNEYFNNALAALRQGAYAYNDSILFFNGNTPKRYYVDTAIYRSGYCTTDGKKFYSLYRRPAKGAGWSDKFDLWDVETGKVLFSELSTFYNFDLNRKELQSYRFFYHEGIYKFIDKNGVIIYQQSEKFDIMYLRNNLIAVVKVARYPLNSKNFICFIDLNDKPAKDLTEQ